MLLSVESLVVCYGKAVALKEVSIQISDGEVVSIVGNNGAGKTTLFHTISGLIRPKSGQILFKQKMINRLEPDEVTRLGIAHVPERKELFNDLSVKDNLLMGAYLIKDKQTIAKTLEQIFTYFPILKDRQNQLAQSLSGGEQQMLAMARALMCQPKLLMLDEPTLGLAPMVVGEIGRLITQLSQGGIAILLVEQNARFAFALASRAYVLHTGTVVHQGRVADLCEDRVIKQVYLGT